MRAGPRCTATIVRRRGPVPRVLSAIIPPNLSVRFSRARHRGSPSCGRYRHPGYHTDPRSDPRHPPRAESAGSAGPGRATPREKVAAIIRRQKPMRPRGERQFARRHVRHDLVVRGASDPIIAGQAIRLTHLCRADQRSQCFTVVFFGPDDAVLTRGLTDGSAPARGRRRRGRPRRI